MKHFSCWLRNPLAAAFVFLAAALARAADGGASASGIPDENTARAQIPLLSGWKFHRGAVPGAERTELDDRSWDAVSLPHTWNGEDGQDGHNDYFRGDGWYRRIVHPDDSWANREIFLQFDGANRTAEVFLNGSKVGEHRGGTARFRFDVTGQLRIGTDNLLAVRVNNDPHDGIIPVNADFTFCGGLYRAVSLVATDPVHVDLLDYAAPGVYARPVDVSPAAAKLDVEVKLANDGEQPADLLVRSTLLDAAGQSVQAATWQVKMAARARDRVLRRLLVPQPHLWDGRADPYLYRLRTEVLVANQVRDTVTLPVGLRFFSVDPQKGFFLNGRHLDLHGVNRHQERRNKGWAISDADERQDFALIADLGATAIRQSHYQQSQRWQSLGDEHGMIYWAELGFVNDVKDDSAFFANARQQLRELIRQNFHHPAICFWSIGNETFVRDRGAVPPDTNNRLLAELASEARAEDPSRLSTYASNGDVTEPRASFPDVIGFNHYFGWYHGALADFAPWLDRQHAQRPDLCIGMSEYGAGANPGQHDEIPHQPEAAGAWHPEEWQALYHESYWKTLAARPWVWGKFVWCMFDFASDGRNEGGRPGINDKGLVTQDRATKKEAFFFYQANWSDQPVLHLAGGRSTRRHERIVDLKAYSNCDSVQLRVNGTLIGTAAPDDLRTVHWPQVELRPGKNAVEIRGERNGNVLTDAAEWTLGE